MYVASIQEEREGARRLAVVVLLSLCPHLDDDVEPGGKAQPLLGYDDDLISYIHSCTSQRKRERGRLLFAGL